MGARSASSSKLAIRVARTSADGNDKNEWVGAVVYYTGSFIVVPFVVALSDALRLGLRELGALCTHVASSRAWPCGMLSNTWRNRWLLGAYGVYLSSARR